MCVNEKLNLLQKTKIQIIPKTNIPKPVWAVGFALEQTLRDATLAAFSFANFKTASAYKQYLNNYSVLLCSLHYAHAF
ncbi:MAG: hypothetical protein LBH59_05460 [Planctomycetaceae bacterium]|jgi:hypothetical protein|nr:hypothetical protein [Planctomycetaceae bacterium]